MDRPSVNVFNILDRKYHRVEYPTYRELRKNLKHLIQGNIEGSDRYCDVEPSITVIRYKRGEWGEWFENWELHSGKPVKVKKGWM